MRSETRLRAEGRHPRRGRARPRPSALLALDSDGGLFDPESRRQESCLVEAFALAFGEGLSPSLAAWAWTSAAGRPGLRGASRYRILSAALRLLVRLPEAGLGRERRLRSVEALEVWLSLEPAPSARRLVEAAAGSSSVPGAALRGGWPGGSLGKRLLPVLAWQRALETGLAALPPPRPFAAARGALSLLAGRAEFLAFGALPEAELRRDWRRARILGRASAFLGEEAGDPGAALASYAALASAEGRISSEKLLLLSSRPLGQRLARALGAVFYPIPPGREEEAWSRLAEGGFERFLAGESAPAGEALAAFLRNNPPVWRSPCT